MDKIKKAKKKKKYCKKIDPPPLGFEPQIFEQTFSTQDLNFEDQSSSLFLKKSRLYSLYSGCEGGLQNSM